MVLEGGAGGVAVAGLGTAGSAGLGGKLTVDCESIMSAGVTDAGLGVGVAEGGAVGGGVGAGAGGGVDLAIADGITTEDDCDCTG